MITEDPEYIQRLLDKYLPEPEQRVHQSPTPRLRGQHHPRRAAMPHVKQMTKNLPEMMPLPRVPEVFGVSRSGLYRLAAEGKIRMVKLGARTLVDISTLRDFLANLPTLVVKAGARSSNSP